MAMAFILQHILIIRRFVRYFLIVFLIAVPCLTRAQWQQLPGPYGGQVYTFLDIAGSNGGRIYAGTPDGVWLTTDHASTWRRAGLQGTMVPTLIQFTGDTNREILFGLVGHPSNPSGIVRSTDSGNTWTLVNLSTRFDGQWIFCIIQNGSKLLVSVQLPDTASSWGVIQSSDLGDTWQTFGSTLIADPVIVKVDSVILGFDNSSALIWSIPDTGGTWTNIGRLPGTTGTAIFTSGEEIYATGEDVSKSTDHGVTWVTPANTNLGILWEGVEQLGIIGDTLVAADNYGTWLSTDGAESWTDLGGKNGFPVSQNYRSAEGLAYIDGKLFAGNMAGVLTSKDGINWDYQSDGFTDQEFYNAVSLKGTLYASTPRGIYQSINRGLSWIVPDYQFGLRDSSLPYDLFSYAGKLYAGADWMGGLWRLDSSGWTTLSDLPFASLAGDRTYLFGSFQNYGVMRSGDSGRTWNPIDSGLPNLDYLGLPETFGIFAIGPRIFVAVSEPDPMYGYEEPIPELYLSTDQGNSWSFQRSLSNAYGNSSTEAVSFASSDSALYVSTVSYVLRSTDSGLSWDTLAYPAGSAVRSFQNGLVLVEGNVVSRIYANRQTDFLMSFQGLPSPSGFTADDTFIYVATASDGIWRTTLANLPMGVQSAQSNLSQSSLSIYPNPLSSKSTMAFDLASGSYVSLRLYDELGIVRSDIFEGEMHAGHYEIQFSSQELANGVYSIVLSTGENRAVGRLLIER
jgi:photosystem II stability/assembly factor-like uncharacterized protein